MNAAVDQALYPAPGTWKGHVLEPYLDDLAVGREAGDAKSLRHSLAGAWEETQRKRNRICPVHFVSLFLHPSSAKQTNLLARLANV